MKAELYANTGFNAVNVPDSITTLRSLFTPVKTYDNINLNQSIWQPELRVSGLDPKVARTVDYVVIQGDPILEESAYTVDNFSFVAPGTCSFKLYIDAYNTMGGLGASSGNLVVSGTAKRMHVTVADDTSQFFTLMEPFQNAQRETVTLKSIGPTSYGVTQFIEVTSIPPCYVDALITKSEHTFNGFKLLTEAVEELKKTPKQSATQQNIVTASQTIDGVEVKTIGIKMNTELAVRQVDVPTVVSIKYVGGSEAKLGNNSRIYDLNTAKGYLGSKLVSILDELIKYNLQSAIAGIWEVPDAYVTKSSDNQYNPEEDKIGGLGELKSNLLTNECTLPAVTCYNNKVRYGQSASIKLISPASGNQTDKPIYEVQSNTPGATPIIPIHIVADVRCGGSPIAIFVYKNQVYVGTTPVDFVVGGKWKTPLTSTNQLQGEYQQRQSAIIARNAEKKNLGQGNLYGIGTGLVNAATGAGVSAINDGTKTGTYYGLEQSDQNTSMAGIGIKAIGNTLNTFLNTGLKDSMSRTKMIQQLDMLEMNGSMAGTNITIGSNQFFNDRFANNFIVVVSQYSNDDIVNFDTFLTRFGYNVGNKKITNADFYSRPAYNFVQVNEMTIQSVTGNEALVDLAIDQLKVGLRIWHKAPNAADMEASGNR